MRKIDTLDRKQLITIGKKLKIGNYIGNYSKPYLRKEDLKNMIIKALEKKSTSNSNLVTHVNKSDFKQNLSKKSCNRIQNKETNYSINNEKCCFPKVEKLVAIGDIHGDLVVAIKCLKLAGVIDISIPNNTKNINIIHWIGGNIHVVQLGDQIDRVRPSVLVNDICPDNDEIVEDEGSDLKIICLFNNLNKEAQKVGGACLSILGNHELMNVNGDFRYVSPKEFREFGNFFKASKSLKNSKYPYGYLERKSVFQCGGVIAIKLAQTRYYVVQVGSWVFVHGGLTPKIANAYTLDKINKIIKDWLIGCKKPDTIAGVNKLYHTDDDDNSPFWSRLLSDHEEWEPGVSDKLFHETIEAINKNNDRTNCDKVRGMILGHSPQFMFNKGINSSCNNSLWRVDVGMSRAFGSVEPSDEDYKNRLVQVLVIKNDNEFFIVKEK